MICIAGAVLVFLTLPFLGYLAPLCQNVAASRQYEAAVVLSAEQGKHGQAIGKTVLRLRAGLDLLHRGIVPELVLSGGVVAKGATNSLGDAMRQWALQRDMARPEQLVVEGRSLSTLENALYSAPMLPDDFVIVSEGFHLLRSWASFLWAGRVPSGMCRADAWPPRWDRALTETEKWGFNILRGGVYSTSRLLGLAPYLPDSFLN